MKKKGTGKKRDRTVKRDLELMIEKVHNACGFLQSTVESLEGETIAGALEELNSAEGILTEDWREARGELRVEMENAEEKMEAVQRSLVG